MGDHGDVRLWDIVAGTLLSTWQIDSKWERGMSASWSKLAVPHGKHLLVVGSEAPGRNLTTAPKELIIL